MQWVPHAISLARQDPALKTTVLAVIRGRVVTAPAMEAADLLELSTGLLEGEEATLAWASAARIVKDQLRGDPGLDKGWYGSLSWLLEKSGQAGEALAVLERASASFPDEPTFHAAIARLHLRQSRPDQALVAAEEACEQSWGDNLLTSTRLRAEALIALGRMDEARKVVKAALAEVPAPPEGTDVRTHRYRAQLQELVSGAQR
jgi:predicted Zn-dependent protease